MKFHWYFPKTEYGIDGVSSIDHFSSHSPIESFARELVQNALDARYDKTKPVVLNFSYTPNLAATKSGLATWNELKDDLQNVLSDKPFNRDFSNLEDRALVVHETNTIGLTGDSKFWREPNEENSNDHWSNFMYRDNWGTKQTGGGSTGNGKITYTLLSNLNALIIATHRSKTDDLWAFCELHTFLGIDFLCADLTKVLIIAIKSLRFEIIFNSHLDARIDDADAEFIFDG